MKARGSHFYIVVMEVFWVCSSPSMDPRLAGPYVSPSLAPHPCGPLCVATHGSTPYGHALCACACLAPASCAESLRDLRVHVLVRFLRTAPRASGTKPQGPPQGRQAGKWLATRVFVCLMRAGFCLFDAGGGLFL